MQRLIITALTLSFLAFLALPAAAGPFFFSTGNPDGLIATASRPASPGKVQTETADDFVLPMATSITSATFTGLIPSGASLSSIKQVEVEIYHVFPVDSNVGRTSGPPTFSTPLVPTRVNSPADTEIGSATRDSLAGNLTYTPGIINASFTAANSVLNGINPTPNQFTGGEGPVTGQEVTFNVLFTTPISLSADHYFFRPEVLLDSGDFYWLSARRPIVPPGTDFPAGFTDLQSWIRNDNLDPDWLRIGTDITHQGPFNATFTLSGTEVPLPGALPLLGTGLAGLAVWRRLKRSV
jgi:hypothetical protein